VASTLPFSPQPFRDAEITLDPLGWGEGEILLIPFNSIPAKGDPIGLIQLIIGDRGLTFGRSLTGGVVLGKVPGYWTCPYDGIITGVILSTNQGGFTMKFWKAPGRIPTAADSINRVGYTIAPPDTNKQFPILNDFTTISVAAGDTFAEEIIAITDPTPTDIAGNIVISKL
jgi:hypothetical protein